MYRLFLVFVFFITAITLVLISATITLARQKNIKTRVIRVRTNTITQATTPTIIQSIPTHIPTVTLLPTPTPTSIPIQSKPTLMPTPTHSEPKTTLGSSKAQPDASYQSFIMQAINSYRASKGLPAVATNSETCTFAKIRAEEIARSFTHDGFRMRIESKSLPYPSYTSVTENIAMNSDHTQVVSQWINSSGHAANMEKDTPFVCVERVGNYYAYEGWKP